MEIQKQHKRNVYNLGFCLLFIGLVAAQLFTLWQKDGSVTLGITDFILITFAVFRLTRLFVYDGAMQFMRDLFIDIEEKKGQLIRVKKPFGLQRSLSDIFNCPWCFSMWGGSIFVWAYIMHPAVMMYVALVLMVSAAASVLQISTNLLGSKAEHAKTMAEKERH